MNKMKKFLAAFIAIGTLLTMAGCGADETSDSTISTSKSESVTDKETAEQTELVVEEKTEVTAMELADDAVLEIDMGNGEKISYHGQPFSEFMSELETRFGVEFKLVESKKSDVQYKTYKTIDYFKTSNGNYIKFNYSVDNKELSINIEGLNSVKNNDGDYDITMLDFTLGDISATTTYDEFVKMGAKTSEEDSDKYWMASENFETKGVKIQVSDNNNVNNRNKDYIVAKLSITFTGVEE